MTGFDVEIIDAMKRDLQGQELAKRGLQATREKRHGEAVRAYEAALAAEPGHEDHRFQLALALLQDGQLNRARDELEALLQADASKGRWHSALAVVLNKQGDRKAAIDAMRRAIALDGDVGNRLKLLTTWEAREGGTRSDPPALVAQARAHRARGEWSKALTLLDQAIAASEKPAGVWLAFRAECQARIADPERFRERAAGEASEAYYDSHFATSEDYARAPEETNYLPVWEWIIDRLPKTPGIRVLDIGCGPGQFATLLLSRRPDVLYTGLDFSATAIEQAGRRCPAATFIRADAVRTDAIENASYDVVVSTEFLEHVEEDTAVLSRLRPGAPFFGSVPNFDSLSHVRFFEGAGAVAERYGLFFERLEIASIPTGGKRILHTFTGVLREPTEPDERTG